MEKHCLINVLKHEEAPRVPVIFLASDYAARMAGYTLNDIRCDVNKLYDSQTAFQQKTDADWLMLYSDPLFIPEAMACKVESKGRGLEITEFLDIDTFLEYRPIDFENTASSNTVLAAIAKAEAEGHGIPIATLFEGPFTTCARVFGLDTLLYRLIADPGSVLRAVTIITQLLKDFAKEAFTRGARVFCIPDPMSSKNMISPRHYSRMVQSYHKDLVEYIHRLGGYTILHICGDTRDRLDQMVATKADALSLDQLVDLGEVRQAIGTEVVLAGNVNPIASLLRGTLNDVIRNTRQCLEKGGPSRFILMPGCGVPPGSPLENLQAMVRTARQE